MDTKNWLKLTKADWDFRFRIKLVCLSENNIFSVFIKHTSRILILHQPFAVLAKIWVNCMHHTQPEKLPPKYPIILKEPKNQFWLWVATLGQHWCRGNIFNTTVQSVALFYTKSVDEPKKTVSIEAVLLSHLLGDLKNDKKTGQPVLVFANLPKYFSMT